MRCKRCNKEIVQPDGSFGTGYAVEADGSKVCYACCAKKDKEQMRSTGKAVLYLDAEKRQVTNWPGTLRFDVTKLLKGRHNIAGVRYDVWFNFGGCEWHGVTYGDNTQICKCKRNKVAYGIIWDNLANHLRHRSKEICKLNGCTEDDHNCESYAYIAEDGTLANVRSSDYFQGWGSEDEERHGKIAAIQLPWDGNGEELMRAVESDV